ncbi:MAG: hypothetical protein AB3N14_13215 [Flavobacteriaceae bacterium]
MFPRIFKLSILIWILLSVNGCKNEETVFVHPELKKRLVKSIVEYSNFVVEKRKEGEFYDPPIYELTFKEYSNECYVVISTNNHYKSNLDGYFFSDGKLVTFNELNLNCNEDYVKVNSEINPSDLENFKSDQEAYDNYSPAYWVFKIEDGNFIDDTQGRLKISF